MKIPEDETRSPGTSDSVPPKNKSKPLSVFKPISYLEETQSSPKETGSLRRDFSAGSDLTPSPKPNFFDRVRSVFRSQSRTDSLPSTPFSPNTTVANDLATPEGVTSLAEEFFESRSQEVSPMQEPCRKALRQLQLYRSGYVFSNGRSIEIRNQMKKQEPFVEKNIVGDMTRGFDVTINSRPLLPKEQIEELKSAHNNLLERSAILSVQDALNAKEVPIHVRPYLNQTIANQIFSVLQMELEESGIPFLAEEEKEFGIALRKDNQLPVKIDLEEIEGGWKVKGEIVIFYQDTDLEQADEEGWKVVGSLKLNFSVQIPNDPMGIPTYRIQAFSV